MQPTTTSTITAKKSVQPPFIHTNKPYTTLTNNCGLTTILFNANGTKLYTGGKRYYDDDEPNEGVITVWNFPDNNNGINSWLTVQKLPLIIADDDDNKASPIIIINQNQTNPPLVVVNEFQQRQKKSVHGIANTRYFGHSSTVTALALAPTIDNDEEPLLASGTVGGEIFIWNTTTFDIETKLEISTTTTTANNNKKNIFDFK
jgi:WD40 repeat protein